MAVLFIILILVVGFTAYHFLMQRLEQKVIYRPFRYVDTYRRSLHPEFEEIPYSTQAGNGIAFFLQGKGGGVIVAFNGARRSALDWMVFFEGWNDADAQPSVLLLDFPMTGHSEGRLNELNIQRHAEEAFAEIIRLGKCLPTSPIGILGFSLGCCPATKWASRHRRVKKILLLAPMTSLREIARWKGRRFAWILRHKLDAAEGLRTHLSFVRDSEVLIVHDQKDGVVPAWMGQKLRDVDPTRIKLRLQNEGHDEPHDLIHRESVKKIAQQFLRLGIKE